MQCDPLYYPYPSRRNVVYARRGMVATSQPLAAQAGLDMLRRGGNAVDAAVAAAACLTVVEPVNNGIGGDAFAQVWADGRLYALNSSGPAPARLNLGLLRERGYDAVPERGALPVTVPGVPAAWAALAERFGRFPLAETLRPAMEYAEQGFPVSPITGELWAAAVEVFRAHGEEALRPWFDAFAPEGHAPAIGSLWRLPQQAETLARIAESKGRDFYDGSLAAGIDAFMRRVGGCLRGEDLATFAPRWVEPLCMEYRGYHVWELPPNGHGIVVLMALNILRHFNVADRDDPRSLHATVEAVKLAFADGLAQVADPAHMRVRVKDLLAADYGRERAGHIGKTALMPAPGRPHRGGTVYLAAADADGMMVSYIQSNYLGFGSGLVVPGTGIALNNRGACFSTEDGHPNCVAPGKLPYHTIIPGFLTKDGTPVGPFGMMGGYIQPQGHVMLISHMLDSGLNPQAALDAPRFRWKSGRIVEVEAGFPEHLAEALRRRGHDVRRGGVGDRDFGRGQIILRDAEGVLTGGTEPRTDGQIAAW